MPDVRVPNETHMDCQGRNDLIPFYQHIFIHATTKKASVIGIPPMKSGQASIFD